MAKRKVTEFNRPNTPAQDETLIKALVDIGAERCKAVGMWAAAIMASINFERYRADDSGVDVFEDVADAAGLAASAVQLLSAHGALYENSDAIAELMVTKQTVPSLAEITEILTANKGINS